MLAHEKSTSLAELFFFELKFSIDTLNASFSNTIKLKFLELDDIKKQRFIKENSIVPSETIFCICGYLFDVTHERGEGEHKSLYDFMVECEHLFFEKYLQQR